MNLNYLVDRVHHLVIRPKQEWAAIEEEEIGVARRVL